MSASRECQQARADGAASASSAFEITRFEKSGPDPAFCLLTERIALAADGRLISDGSACVMSEGWAHRARLKHGLVRMRIAAAGGYWPTIVSVVPALSAAGHIIRASTSADIRRMDTGATRSDGQHIYLVAADGTDAAADAQNVITPAGRV